MIGGLWGRTVYDWLFVEHLFVPEHLRGRGLGTALMRKAEEVAIARDCIGVCLDTFDFNAPGFYRKLGYEELPPWTVRGAASSGTSSESSSGDEGVRPSRRVSVPGRPR